MVRHNVASYLGLTSSAAPNWQLSHRIFLKRKGGRRRTAQHPVGEGSLPPPKLTQFSKSDFLTQIGNLGHTSRNLIMGLYLLLPLVFVGTCDGVSCIHVCVLVSGAQRPTSGIFLSLHLIGNPFRDLFTYILCM